MLQASNTGATKGRTSIKAQEAIVAIRASVELGKRLYPTQAVVYACYYSQIPLVTDKTFFTRGDYVSFDHAIPNVASRAVLCSRIINDFKGLMTDGEFSTFVCQVLDLSAPRRLHGLTVEQTKAFLTALQIVMRDDVSAISDARKTLKALSSRIRYERARLVTPGESITVERPEMENPGSL